VSPRQCANELSGSLADLGRLAQAGNPQALDSLLRRVQEPVYRYLLRRLLAAPDAEDLARDLCQEALIRAMGSIGRSTFASDGRLVAWVLTIARNVLLDHLRQARRRAEVRGDSHWARTASAGLLPGEDVAPPRLLEMLAAEALAAVPEGTAELLRLRLVVGRSWKEVADALGIAETAVKRRFQRAQAALRRRILVRLGELSPDESLLRRLAPDAGRCPDGAVLRSPAAECGTPGGSAGDDPLLPHPATRDDPPQRHRPAASVRSEGNAVAERHTGPFGVGDRLQPGPKRALGLAARTHPTRSVTMSQWNGSFSVVNNTGGTIYSGQVSHYAANCQSTAIDIPSDGLPNGGSLGGGTWQTETTSRDFWSWSYLTEPNGPGVSVSNKQCSLEHGDTSVIITITSSGGTITPNSSSSCTASDD
jgi:RNA polymerase sigma-70 factor (ECF subfamily)